MPNVKDYENATEEKILHDANVLLQCINANKQHLADTHRLIERQITERGELLAMWVKKFGFHD